MTRGSGTRVHWHRHSAEGERMRAAVLHQVGDEKLAVVDDVEVVDVGPGMVRVAIRGTGVCHSDLSVMSGTFGIPMPCVLGHEGAGEVIEVGPGVTDLA